MRNKNNATTNCYPPLYLYTIAKIDFAVIVKITLKIRFHNLHKV